MLQFSLLLQVVFAVIIVGSTNSMTNSKGIGNYDEALSIIPIISNHQLKDYRSVFVDFSFLFNFQSSFARKSTSEHVSVSNYLQDNTGLNSAAFLFDRLRSTSADSKLKLKNLLVSASNGAWNKDLWGEFPNYGSENLRQYKKTTGLFNEAAGTFVHGHFEQQPEPNADERFGRYNQHQLYSEWNSLKVKLAHLVDGSFSQGRYLIVILWR